MHRNFYYTLIKIICSQYKIKYPSTLSMFLQNLCNARDGGNKLDVQDSTILIFHGTNMQAMTMTSNEEFKLPKAKAVTS